MFHATTENKPLTEVFTDFHDFQNKMMNEECTVFVFLCSCLCVCDFHLGMLPLQLERRKSLWLWKRLSTITAWKGFLSIKNPSQPGEGKSRYAKKIRGCLFSVDDITDTLILMYSVYQMILLPDRGRGRLMILPGRGRLMIILPGRGRGHRGRPSFSGRESGECEVDYEQR